MERLTKRDAHGRVVLVDSTGWSAVEKLADYEDAEEKGKLVILPCKVDEFVWVAKHGEKTRRVLLDSASTILWEIEHGYAIGYTKEEAEAALNNMKKGV